MATITASDARRCLFPLLGQINDDHSVVTITSKAGNGVLISEADYETWLTTMHLFSTPSNARRLVEAIDRSENGNFEAHELDRG